MAGKVTRWPERKVRTRLVPKAARVIATLVPAAMQSVASPKGKPVHREIALPTATPANIRGKIKPPRRPPATVKLIAASFAKPTRRLFAAESDSKPNIPDVGHT